MLLVVSAIGILRNTIRRRIAGSKRDPGLRGGGSSLRDPRILAPKVGVVLLVLAGVIWPFVVDGGAGSQDMAGASLDRVVVMWFVAPLLYTSTVTVIALAAPHGPITAYRLFKDLLNSGVIRHGQGGQTRPPDDHRD